MMLSLFLFQFVIENDPTEKHERKKKTDVVYFVCFEVNVFKAQSRVS